MNTTFSVGGTSGRGRQGPHPVPGHRKQKMMLTMMVRMYPWVHVRTLGGCIPVERTRRTRGEGDDPKEGREDGMKKERQKGGDTKEERTEGRKK